MRSAIAALLPLLASAATVVPNPPVNNPNGFIRALTARLDHASAPYVPLSHKEAIPAVSELPSRYSGPLFKDAKRRRIRYGPFIVPSQNEKMSMADQAGNPALQFEPPEKGQLNKFIQIDPVCKGCVVLNGHLVIEFADGTHANINRGTYLHHAVMFNSNRGGTASNQCPGAVDPFGQASKLFLAGGSDGSVLAYTPTDGSLKNGFHVLPSDKYTLLTDIMNYNDDAQTVYVVADFDYVDGNDPSWLDTTTQVINLGSCNQLPNFDLPSATWSGKSNTFDLGFKGYIVNTVGHVHDGGKNVEIYLNDKLVCDSQAQYGTSSEYVKAATDGKKWATIGEMTTCKLVRLVDKTDTMRITASYDLNAHPLRMNNDKEGEQVMGLAVINVAQPFVAPA